jgi:hypothetical protein
MKLSPLIALCLLITACAPAGYVQQPWASISREQAEAECYDAVQANPLRAFPRCMEAKGYKVYY